MNWEKQSLALAISGSLVLATAQTGCADAMAQTPAPTLQAPALQAMGQSPGELNQLVAPIALYPDNLVAQVLAASTLPGEVVEADRWMQQHSGLKGTAFAQAVNQQVWDPSVKSLTQFPLVLANMNKNLSWSSALGNAYAEEPQSVLDAIQVMRRRAQQSGHLMGTPNEIVTTEGDTILIQPADASTVYLPEYDPWLVYGAPVDALPGWYGLPGLYADDSDILFRLGVGIGAFAGFGWGWHHWGTDWRGHHVTYNQSPFRTEGRTFANRSDFHGTSFGHAGGFHDGGFAGGGFHGAMGAGNRGFAGFNHGGIGLNRGGFAGGFGARGFGGGFHVATGGFHGGGGGFHGGGGGGHR
jgi:hypothetical protein